MLKNYRARKAWDCAFSPSCFTIPHFSFFCVWLPADHPSRVSGRTENDTAWELRREGDGFIVVNGRKALRDVMVCDRVQHPQQNMRAHGRTGCRMATARKHMLTEVKSQHKKTNWEIFKAEQKQWRSLWRFGSKFNLCLLLCAVMCLDIKVFIVWNVTQFNWVLFHLNSFRLPLPLRNLSRAMAARNATWLWRSTISSIRLGIALSTQIYQSFFDVVAQQWWQQQSSAYARSSREAKSSNRRFAWRICAKSKVRWAATATQQFSGKD